MNPPTISVIIPTYNQAHYILESIRSVLNQTYPDFELIVVDDGSTDETPQSLALINDIRLQVIRQANKGLSAARNAGIKESTAPLITFLDSDDFFFPDKLAVLSKYLNNHPNIGLVSGGTQYIDQDGHQINQNIKSLENLTLSTLLVSNPVCVSAIMMRRSWIDQVGLFDETLKACEDWDLWQRLAYTGCQFASVEHIVVAYRYHVGQMTNESDRMRKATLTVIDKFFRQTGIPDEIIARKNSIYASALLKAAAYAYNANEHQKAQNDIIEAVRLNPNLADMGYKKLIARFVSWSSDPRSVTPAIFLQRIIRNPPPGMPGLKRELHRALADVLLEPIFSSPRKNRRAHRWDLVKAILYKPEWLLNRGVLRMFVDAWVLLG